MANDAPPLGLSEAMTRNFSVVDLVRAAETLKQSGQLAAVEQLYASWIRHNASHPLLYAVRFNYSVALSDAGKLEPARECLEQAIAQNAEFLPAYINLGRVYERLGRVGPAVVQWSAVIAKLAAVDGNAITYKTTALNQSARALEAANQDEPAEAMLRQSLELDRQQREVVQHFVALRQRQCEWPVLQTSDRVSHELLVKGMSPLSAAACADDPVLQLALAAHYNRHDVGTPSEVFETWPQAAAHRGPLRIGYLSSDLREHAMGYLLAEVFGLHDRTRVEVVGYYCGPDSSDPLHQHFQSVFDRWVRISELDDDAAAHRIRDDGIQILVDLNGYTRDARLKLVARRPAPVIVNWLGFPGTMASPYHHFLIADDWIVPESHERYYSEKVLRLPCYQPSNRQRTVAAPAPTRRDAGLPDDAMVYCCFNGAHKIHRFTFERWMTILSRVPGSVLWLLGGTAATNERLRQQASARGVAPERLVFADKMANPQHLARYPLADLFLDSAPYGAHTTGSDALWMGVPVLTFSGRSFASRVCGSLVRAAGLPELVCTSAADYVERAVAFGLDRAALQPLRARLSAGRNTCTLFDLPRLVRELENLFHDAWRQYQEGKLPRPDLTNLEDYLDVGCRVNHDEFDAQGVASYHDWWIEMLAARHRHRPLPLDQRLVTDPNRFR